MPDRLGPGVVCLLDDRLQQIGRQVLVDLERVDALLQEGSRFRARLVGRSHVGAVSVTPILARVRTVDDFAGDEHPRALDASALQGLPLREDPLRRVRRGLNPRRGGTRPTYCRGLHRPRGGTRPTYGREGNERGEDEGNFPHRAVLYAMSTKPVRSSSFMKLSS